MTASLYDADTEAEILGSNILRRGGLIWLFIFRKIIIKRQKELRYLILMRQLYMQPGLQYWQSIMRT